MKLGRNEPCSCNSGKKYKKCCLTQPSADVHTVEFLEPPRDSEDQVKRKLRMKALMLMALANLGE